MGKHVPELGIYDTRAWDHIYSKWLRNNGPNPGKHPDPDCVWNENYNDYRAGEYQENQKNLRKKARE